VANAKKAEVPIKLEGKEYRLRFDFNALAEMEDEFKEPVHVFLAGLTGNKSVGVKMIRQFIFHGLQANHSDEFVDVESVGAVLDLGSIKEYADAMSRALSLALTGSEPGENKKNGKVRGADPLPEKTETTDPGTGMDS
jgi:hypothetical protein